MKKEPIIVAQIIGKWVGGGVEAVVMNYYRNIDRTKIQFHFICDNDSTDIPYDEIQQLGGKVILIPPYQKIFKYISELKKILAQGKYKIVHSHINALSCFSLFAAKKANIPVRIAHSHSTTNKKEWKKNILKQILKPLSKRYATDYFACTEHAGRWLFGDKTFKENKIYILNNAIELDKFKYRDEIRNKKRKELQIENDKFVIGHIGRFVTQKNHNFIIDVFKQLCNKNNNVILLLVGQGPDYEKIKAKVSEFQLEEKVFFLGQRNDVAELYQAMDLFLFPSLYEGLGMVAIEAQTSNLPCICSTEVPSIVKINNDLKFIDLKDNISVWVREIENVINKEKIRNNNYKKIKQKGYDIRTEAKKLREKYENLNRCA